jgi:hypothetical protein
VSEKKIEWTEIKGGNIFNFEKENETLEGKLVDVRADQGKYKSVVYDIEKADGELVSLFGATVLDGRMKRVKIGDYVKILFKGTVKSKTGREYADFQVFTRESESKKSEVS